MKYIVIPNLEEYQHYKNRNAIWIKLYLRILNSDKIDQLNDWEKWYYIALLLLATRNDNKTPLRRSYVRQKCAISSRKDVIKSAEKMAKIGLIRIVSDSKVIDHIRLDNIIKDKNVHGRSTLEKIKDEKKKLIDKFNLNNLFKK